MQEKRKVIDCRWLPTDTAAEVLKAAAEHAISSHGCADTPELREELRQILRDEEA